MRKKNFVAYKKQQKRRKRAKQKARLYEQGQIKYSDLPRLAKEMVAKKRRAEARLSAA